MRLREDAEEMLKAIEDSSRETNDAYDKLKAGYLRLWKLGALRGFDELRICLFRLVLCSFIPLSVDRLTRMLQNWIGSNRLYDRLSDGEVESLYSNFLVGDVVKQDLRFTHNSAREFVMTEILGKISEGGQKPLASLTMKECHRSVAKLFMDYMQRSNRSDVSGDYGLSYFGQFGFQHCIYAAEKQSIFDKVWSDMIQRVLLPLKLRSFDIIYALHTYCNLNKDRYLKNTRLFIHRESEGKPHFLFSHFLVWLDIIHDDDVSLLRRMDLRTAPTDTGTPEGMLRHFSEQAVMQDTSGEANVLHIACLRRNAAAVRLVLESTYNLFGKEACTKLLSQELEHPQQRIGTPFVLAVTDDYVWGLRKALRSTGISTIRVMETLLQFESRYLDTAGGKEKANSSRDPHRVQQWSHVCYGHWNALTCAVRKFDEEIVRHLLKIVEPIAINECDPSGDTPLMAAASSGRLKNMQILVEDYHADLNIRGRRGKSALDVARRHYQEAASNYLEERMRLSEPGKSVDPSSKANENTC